MINNKSNIEMQLATYKSMLTKASNDLAKSKQLVGLLKQQIEQGNTELSEELDKANMWSTSMLPSPWKPSFV